MTPKDLDRLTKTLLMTTSSHDGEVLAAINRANAILAAADATWYDVILQGTAQLSREQMQTIYDSGYERGFNDGREQARPKAAWGDEFIDINALAVDDIRNLLTRCFALASQFGNSIWSSYELEFIQSFRDRLTAYGDDLRISPKQQVVLNKIKRKLESLEH